MCRWKGTHKSSLNVLKAERERNIFEQGQQQDDMRTMKMFRCGYRTDETSWWEQRICPQTMTAWNHKWACMREVNGRKNRLPDQTFTKASYVALSWSLCLSLCHSNRGYRRPVKLRNSLYVGSAAAVHSLQPAQHVWTDRSLCHTQVSPCCN